MTAPSHRLWNAFLVLMAAVLWITPAGCRKRSPPVVVLPLTAPPTGKMVKSEIVLTATEAMSEADVGMLLRSGFSETDLIGEIRHRGMAQYLDDAAVGRLTAAGASPTVIAVARDWNFILTPAEYQRYLARTSMGAAERVNVNRTVERQIAAREAAEREERRRQQEIQETIRSRAEKDRQLQEAARARYHRELAEIERLMERERNYLRDLFQSGYKESDWSIRDTKRRIKELEQRKADLRLPTPQ